MSQISSSAPDSDDKDAPQDSARAPKTVSSFLMRRTRAMGSSGLQAATIGWVLAGCVFVGFLAGSWLDKHFGTQIWTPILVLLGVVAGFREMFVTLGQVSQSPGQTKMPGQTKPGNVSTSVIKIDDLSAASTALPERKRERLFPVPPPPLASFDTKLDAAKLVSADEHEDEREVDSETILRALMNEDSDENSDDDESPEEVRPQ